MDKNNFFWQIQNGDLPPPPAAATLGIRFTAIDAAAGTIEVEFQARQEFTNPAGEFAPTLNLNVAYQRAARVGLIQGKARIVKRGKDICFLAGELYQDDCLIATATATAMVRSLATGV